jgi:hypothetical protein
MGPAGQPLAASAGFVSLVVGPMCYIRPQRLRVNLGGACGLDHGGSSANPTGSWGYKTYCRNPLPITPLLPSYARILLPCSHPLSCRITPPPWIAASRAIWALIGTPEPLGTHEEAVCGVNWKSMGGSLGNFLPHFILRRGTALPRGQRSHRPDSR